MTDSGKEKPFIVAIDGPAGSGKTTTAKALSEMLGFVYVDTGAMYRTVAYAAARNNIDFADESGVCALLSGLEITMQRTGNAQETLLNGENVEPYIRTSEMAMGASTVSAYPCVREALVRMQREVGYSAHGAILEGRDIGTIVFPDSPCKVFLVADARTRALRRQKQLAESGIHEDLDALERDIALRDEQDATRAVSPLKKAPDAIEVETTNTSIDEQVTMILGLVKGRIASRESGLE